MSKAKEKKESELTAPFLPSLETLPDRPELVEHARSYKHTGKTTMKDEALCHEIINARLHGWGKKRIAREFGVSKWTVGAVMDAAEKEGILAPLKERLSKKAGEIIEDGLDELHERILSGRIADNVLPVVVGVVADKKANWDGQPGMIVEHRTTPVLNVQAVNAFFELAPAPESQSGANPLPASANQQALPAGTTLRTTLPPVIEAELVTVPAAGQPTDREAAASARQPAHPPGGGSDSALPAPAPIASPHGKF